MTENVNISGCQDNAKNKKGAVGGRRVTKACGNAAMRQFLVAASRITGTRRMTGQETSKAKKTDGNDTMLSLGRGGRGKKRGAHALPLARWVLTR